MKSKFKMVLLAGVAVVVATLLGTNFQMTANAASNQFSPNERVVMPGYFNSNKAGYAFHFKTVKVSKKITLPGLTFGDFKNGELYFAVVVKTPVLSKDRRTVKYTYKLSRKQRLSKTDYTMYIRKQSASQYTIWLNKTKQGYLPSTRGKAYRFTRTKSSPANFLAEKYLKPKFVDYYTEIIEKNLQKQTDDAAAAGKPVADWKKDPETLAKIKETASETADKTVQSFLKNF